MRRSSVRDGDYKVRLIGAGLLLLAALCLGVLPAHRGDPNAQPSAAEVCVALVAVCSGCVGAGLLFEGRRLFDPVGGWRSDRNTRGDRPRDDG